MKNNAIPTEQRVPVLEEQLFWMRKLSQIQELTMLGLGDEAILPVSEIDEMASFFHNCRMQIMRNEFGRYDRFGD